MTKGTHLLRSALLALLALAVISGGSLAAGDLFDDDYKDCPHKTRLRDGQISDLSVNRDSDDEDEVNVSWAATDPATWGLGPNAYSTSLVVILDDGSPNTETLSLGSRKTTFDEVDTGREVTVQMAIVVDTADGKYLISDILEKSINQSLTKPSFGVSWMIRGRAAVAAVEADPDADPPIVAADAITGVADKVVKDSMMYYVGYNANFANYLADGATTSPITPRLRIGVKHSDSETDGERGDVDFDSYILRLTDEDGDVISAGDDISTVESKSYYGQDDAGTAEDSDDDFDNELVVTVASITAPAADFNFVTSTTGDYPERVTAVEAVTIPLINVRVSDGDDIMEAMYHHSWVTANSTVVDDTRLTSIRIDGPVIGDVFAPRPDEHRDFPEGVFSSDTSYTIEAWAINEDDEVISPVASLKVRPVNRNLGTITGFVDYLNAAGDRAVTQTEFTVLK